MPWHARVKILLELKWQTGADYSIEQTWKTLWSASIVCQSNLQWPILHKAVALSSELFWELFWDFHSVHDPIAPLVFALVLTTNIVIRFFKEQMLCSRWQQCSSRWQTSRRVSYKSRWELYRTWPPNRGGWLLSRPRILTRRILHLRQLNLLPVLAKGWLVRPRNWKEREIGYMGLVSTAALLSNMILPAACYKVSSDLAITKCQEVQRTHWNVISLSVACHSCNCSIPGVGWRSLPCAMPRYKHVAQ